MADVQRAGLAEGPIQGVGGGPRVQGGGGPTPEIKVAAVDLGYCCQYCSEAYRSLMLTIKLRLVI